MFASLFTYSISLCGKAKISTWLLGEIFRCLACRPLIYSALIWVKAIYELGNQPYVGWRGGRKSSHPPRVCSFKVGLFFFFAKRGIWICMYYWLCRQACFQEKKYCFCCYPYPQLGIFCLSATAGRVSWSSSELKSNLLQSMKERLPLLFHRMVLSANRNPI